MCPKVAFKAEFAHILRNLGLHAVDSDQVLRVAQVESSFLKLGSLNEFLQIDLFRLNEPEVLVLMTDFLIDIGN